VVSEKEIQRPMETFSKQLEKIASNMNFIKK
jgi:hypothetical protein